MSEEQTRIVTEVTRRHRPFTFLHRFRVCAYVRVSTGHDGQQNSLSNQTEYYMKMASICKRNDSLFILNEIITVIFCVLFYR